MPVLRIPTPLRTYTDGKSEVNVNGSNISDALTDLTTQYPALKPHLFNEGGDLRPFVNLFVGENNIKDLQGVNTPIKDGEKIMLIPSIAGGCHTCTAPNAVRCQCCEPIRAERRAQSKDEAGRSNLKFGVGLLLEDSQ